MISKRTIFIGAAVTVLAAGAASAPYAFRAGALYSEKSSARRAMNKLPVDERQNLNAIPDRIELTAAAAESDLVDTLDFEGNVIQVPRPISRSNPSPRSVALSYRRYKVIILHPTSTAEGDSLAQQLHFKNLFEEFSAANHTRLDDLDAQPDLASVKRFLLLISLKLENVGCREEFTRGDVCGFVIAPLAAGKRTVVEVFVRAIRFVPKQPGNAGVGSTRPNERAVH